MTVDVVNGAAPAAAASTDNTPTTSDQTQFDQAFAEALPKAAAFM